MAGPVEFWLNECFRAQNDVDMYSDEFLKTFERSDFFVMCKKTVEGKLEWKEWSDCSVSCGGGTQTKIANSCVPDYAVCYGIQILEQTCNEQVCPIGQWIWNDWSECSVSCNGGLRFRIAQSCEPPGAECEDVPILKESCNTGVCPDGQWTWNDWGDCSNTCGGGIRIKTANRCLPDGAVCDEVPIIEETCNENPCPVGTWSWNDWSDCSASCGGGSRIQTADVCLPEGAVCSESPVREESCGSDACPLGSWTWNDWGECSNSCGGGTRIKTANQCLPEGALCEEVPILEETCNKDPCPYGQWNWNAWSDCSVSCGGGTRTRTPNSCVPEDTICNDVPIKEETCNNESCPVGTWQWSEWGECTVSCGGGVRTRIPQSCEPQNAVCNDIPILEESCNPSNCPDMPSPYLPAGTIISWVPRPNINAPDNVYFDDETWIECNGVITCKKGRFEGQFCSDLSDRVLVGAGDTGNLLQVKDASLPDHAHNHTHSGKHNYSAQYRAGPYNVGDMRSGSGGSNVSKKHHHDVTEE